MFTSTSYDHTSLLSTSSGWFWSLLLLLAWLGFWNIKPGSDTIKFALHEIRRWFCLFFLCRHTRTSSANDKIRPFRSSCWADTATVCILNKTGDSGEPRGSSWPIVNASEEYTAISERHFPQQQSRPSHLRNRGCTACLNTVCIRLVKRDPVVRIFEVCCSCTSLLTCMESFLKKPQRKTAALIHLYPSNEGGNMRRESSHKPRNDLLKK